MPRRSTRCCLRPDLGCTVHAVDRVLRRHRALLARARPTDWCAASLFHASPLRCTRRIHPCELLPCRSRGLARSLMGLVERPRPEDGTQWRQEAHPDRFGCVHSPIDDRSRSATSRSCPTRRGPPERHPCAVTPSTSPPRSIRLMPGHDGRPPEPRHPLTTSSSAIATLNATHIFKRCYNTRRRINGLGHTHLTPRTTPDQPTGHQPDGRVHLDAVASAAESSWPRS